MPTALTGPELAAFIDELRELVRDGDLGWLGAIVLRGEKWDIEEAARDMLARVDEYRRMDPRERAALGPATMRRRLAGDLAVLRDALQDAGLLRAVAPGEPFRVPVRSKPPRLRPDRRR